MSEQNSTTIAGEVIQNDGAESFGANGFRKAVVVINTGGDYPQEIPVEFVKDKADQVAAALNVGDLVTIDCNVRGREYNGRYFASIQGWRWDVTGGVAPAHTESAGDDDNIGF